jgi:hypothetical protein
MLVVTTTCIKYTRYTTDSTHFHFSPRPKPSNKHSVRALETTSGPLPFSAAKPYPRLHPSDLPYPRKPNDAPRTLHHSKHHHVRKQPLIRLPYTAPRTARQRGCTSRPTRCATAHPTRSGATMSLAARLESVITPQTERWVRQSASDIHARLAGVHFDLESAPLDEPSPSSPLRATAEYPRSLRSGSSMAPALIHQSAALSAHPPSLRSCYTEATPTETSISTGLASHFTGVPLLEENNGVLELPRAQVRTPVYECVFWFLSCGYISQNRDEWMIHCESHFRGEDPPRSVQCPLCDWSASCEDGRASWTARMMHLACEHSMLGQTLRTSRPDFGLFQHLWRKRLIDDHDLKELNGGNHNLERPPGNFVETNGRGGRREREERRHRRQHVAANRPPGPQRV